ncbi:MAG: glycoside hydrolase family 78 protein [Phycisphaerae bacterium]|nr:glycoside hydrolase family 78 protein [Phycisphaerae bacterium]
MKTTKRLITEQRNPLKLHQLSRIFIVWVIAVFMVSAIFAREEKDITVADLHCEYRTNPLGIDVVNPRLSWTLGSGVRSQKQTACQVLVATSMAKLSKDKGDLWDSGKIKSDQSAHVLYKGQPLKSRMIYYWKIRVWDKDGKASEWSKPGTWAMGLLSPEDWKAEWIGAEQTAQRPPSQQEKPQETQNSLSKTPFAAILLRREATLKKPVKRAVARICGLGYNEFFINGKRVGDHVLDPGFTDYSKRVLYVTHDVTSLLEKGDNALGVILGGGFYRLPTPDIFGFATAPWTAPPKLLLDIEVEYTDGTQQTIASDPDWKWSTGPIVYQCLRGGETYDARLEDKSWKLHGFDDSTWEKAQKTPAPSGRLVSQQLPPIRAHKTIKPVKLSQPKPGVWVYDLGVNIAGWVRFQTHGPAGQKVTLGFNELLRRDGTVNMKHLSSHTKGRFQLGELILSGREQDTFEPRFTYHGFRYVQITGLSQKPKLDDLVGRWVTTDPEPAGSFECSHDGINKIHELVTRSYLNNLHSIPTDCPQREKMGWLNDGRVTMEAASFNFDVPMVYTKWIHDMQDAQDESGHLASIIPTCGWGRVKGKGAPGEYADPWWGGTIVIAPWVMHQYYGDIRILKDDYPSMKKYVDYLSSTANDHIVKWFLGDWLEVGKGGRPKRTPIPQTSTCAYYYCASIVQQTAELLGHDEDAKKYADLCRAIKESFNRHFLNADTGLYAPDSQTAQALPLFVGLVPDEQKEKVFDQLVKNITERRNGHLSTGIVGTLYLLHVLTDNGRADLAHGIMTKERFPGWLHMIKGGATALWEAWDGGGSRNHPTFGLVGAFFYRNYAGIRPDPTAPGFKKIILKPEIGDGLDWVRADYRSVHGKIKSEWKRVDGKLEMNIDIPVNTTATVYVPAKNVESVTESGKPVNKADGIKFLRMEGGSALFTVGSGSYKFISRQL